MLKAVGRSRKNDSHTPSGISKLIAPAAAEDYHQ
jgi:hypothetical protein